MTAETKNHSIRVNVTEQIKKDISEYAEANRISESEVIRRAVEWFLANQSELEPVVNIGEVVKIAFEKVKKAEHTMDRLVLEANDKFAKVVKTLEDHGVEVPLELKKGLII